MKDKDIKIVPLSCDMSPAHAKWMEMIRTDREAWLAWFLKDSALFDSRDQPDQTYTPNQLTD